MKLYEYLVLETMLGDRVTGYSVGRIDWKGNYTLGSTYDVGEDEDMARALAERDVAQLNGINNQ